MCGTLIRKRIGRHKLPPALPGADDDIDMLAVKFRKGAFEGILQLGNGGVVGIEEQIAGRDQGSHVAMAESSGDAAQVGHGDATSPVDDDAIEQRDMGGHLGATGLRRQ